MGLRRWWLWGGRSGGVVAVNEAIGPMSFGSGTGGLCCL